MSEIPVYRTATVHFHPVDHPPDDDRTVLVDTRTGVFTGWYVKEWNQWVDTTAGEMTGVIGWAELPDVSLKGLKPQTPFIAYEPEEVFE